MSSALTAAEWGTYTATYLSCLATDFAKKRGLQGLDVGGAFDLIVGTSTGAIIACSLAAEVPLSGVIDLYRNHGHAIFPRKLPGRFGFALIRDYFQRPNDLRSGNDALSKALEQALGDMTVAQVYERRKIALAIAAVDLAHHHAWVFKTPHNQPKTNHRDHEYRLVDVCQTAWRMLPLSRCFLGDLRFSKIASVRQMGWRS